MLIYQSDREYRTKKTTGGIQNISRINNNGEQEYKKYILELRCVRYS